MFSQTPRNIGLIPRSFQPQPTVTKSNNGPVSPSKHALETAFVTTFVSGPTVSVVASWVYFSGGSLRTH